MDMTGNDFIKPVDDTDQWSLKVLSIEAQTTKQRTMRYTSGTFFDFVTSHFCTPSKPSLSLTLNLEC
jgi:hypothetical protein